MKRDGFLKQLAHWLYAQYKGDMSKITLVLPNKRAGLFLRKYLSQVIEKPLWAPIVLEISSFVKEMSGLQLPDKHYLIIQLYRSYSRIMIKNGFTPEDFSRFYPWGKIILSDFNEVDKNLLNAKDVFKTIKDLKEIEDHFDYLTDEQIEALQSFWSNIRASSDSEEKKNFLKTWQVLFDVYSDFRASLLKLGYGYEGLIYRQVNNLIKEDALSADDRKYVFAGFNFLTRSEENIFEFFHTSHASEFLWDVSPELLAKEGFRPVEKLREYRVKYAMPDNFKPLYASLPETKITLVGTPGKTVQCKVAGEKLMELMAAKNGTFEFDRNLIVLADENLLFPMLQSIPGPVDPINITMGYPLAQTQLAGFLSLLSELIRRSRKSKDGEIFFHYKVLLSLLSSPYMADENNKVKELRKRIATENLIYIAGSEIAATATLPGKIVQLPQDDNYFDYYLNILRELLIAFEKKENNFEMEFVYQLFKEINRLNEVCLAEGFKLNGDIFFKILREVIQSVSIAFEGEPLGGLQVMGVLETRCLSFENVFILSMNEGVFPSPGGGSSFIPYSVRKAFGLPTHDLEDIIYAYYFYRLLPGIKKLFLFYNTSKNDKEGEMSRFLLQLKYDFDLDIKEEIISNEIKVAGERQIRITKTGDILQKLARYLEPGGSKAFSPTALNYWLDCKLKFYYRYVLELYEKEEVLESVDAATFGLLLHTTMEKLYDSFGKNKMIGRDDIDQSLARVDQVVNDVFSELKSDKNYGFDSGGINTIVNKVIKKYARQILNFDKQQTPFRIISLEHQAEDASLFPVEINERKIRVRLKGIIDRIDEKEGVTRIIDYKSGADQLAFSSVEALFDPQLEKRNKAVFQLLYYSLQYKSQLPGSGWIQPRLYIVKEMYNEDFTGKIQLKQNRKTEVIEDVGPLLPGFRERLEQLLGEIYDPEIAFEPTMHIKHCEWCPYKRICLRA